MTLTPEQEKVIRAHTCGGCERKWPMTKMLNGSTLHKEIQKNREPMYHDCVDATSLLTEVEAWLQQAEADAYLRCAAHIVAEGDDEGHVHSEEFTAWATESLGRRSR